MLGRTADQLYWMARYIERAENMARLLDVTSRMALMPHSEADRASIWKSAMQAGGGTPPLAKGAAPGRNDVLQWVAINLDNPSSIRACLRAARENARALRGDVTTEMWESLNATWLEARELDITGLNDRGIRNFFDWVKERSHLFRGIAEGTMLRDDSQGFINLGTQLERADNTARILDSKYHVLLPDPADVGGAVDYYQWGSVLRSVSSFRAYRRVYKDSITPPRVAELLVLRHDMPRSLHACFDHITAELDKLGGARGLESARIAGTVHAGLHFGRMEDIFQSGLHEFLTEFVDRNIALGAQIQSDFWMVI